jgi:hypothetical protein
MVVGEHSAGYIFLVETWESTVLTLAQPTLPFAAAPFLMAYTFSSISLKPTSKLLPP